MLPRENCFAQALLTEARWARNHVEAAALDLGRPEVLAELTSLQGQLDALLRDLPRLSRDVCNLLDFHPLAAVDTVRVFADAVERAKAAAVRLPRKERPPIARQRLALELTIRVMRICGQYGMRMGATATVVSRSVSPLIQVLLIVGEAARLPRSAHTWRDLVNEARRRQTTEK